MFSESRAEERVSDDLDLQTNLQLSILETLAPTGAIDSSDLWTMSEGETKLDPSRAPRLYLSPGDFGISYYSEGMSGYCVSPLYGGLMR